MKVALDDGHGANTPGKRTPKFPDGSFMKENEFNKRVVEIAGRELKRIGLEVIYTAPGDEDVPLSQRVKTANQAKADIFVSVHANASSGSWGSAEGIETYYFEGSQKSKLLAQIVHQWLLKGTKLKDRGLKRGNHLYVIKNTKMPAVLVECGFMDNLKEAELLRSEEYRYECAMELVNGICEYFGIGYQQDQEEGFADVDESFWAYEDIQYVTKKGYMRGRSNKIFAPNEPVTRAQLAAIIRRMEGGGK